MRSERTSQGSGKSLVVFLFGAAVVVLVNGCGGGSSAPSPKVNC